MSHIFTNAEYADMMYVYGFCDGSATAAVEEYTVDGLLCAEFRIVKCFTRCSIRCVNAVRFPVLMFHLNGHVNKTWRNRKTFLIWYSVALLLAREDFQHVSVFHEHVYGEHCMKTACTHFIHSLCKSTPRGQCHASRILSLVTY